MTSADEIRIQIAELETRLAALERERTDVSTRLDALRQALEAASHLAASPHTPILTHLPVPTTPAEKVRLFRSLFRGREDVFPTRFVSKKTGKPGYAPACTDKFVSGVCGLPKVKCGECPNQAFVPVTDQAVLDHLQDRHVMGVYPLLEDDTCWLLAVDFDKQSWREDASAFAETCRLIGVPVSVERSRSGNGAHAWLFFSAPVPAVMARKLACHLITDTMARHHQFSMESYDRLFPSQDTMPRGGFGNLIALPLQYEPRQKGNTVFLDENLQPYPDMEQWAYLASVVRIDPATAETIVHEATRRDMVIGVRLAESDTDQDVVPWARTPSGTPPPVPIAGTLPKDVRAVLSQRVFVEKTGLPSPLLNLIKRLAAFQNPMFYKKQKMRLSTALTPRVIACAEEFSKHVALPRGCLKDLKILLATYGVTLTTEDQRHEGEPVAFRFLGALTPLQEQAARAILAQDIGVFVAPPGIGKTVLGTFLVAARGRNTLVLVHRRPLLDQWVTQLAMFLGIEEKDIGQVGGGKRKLTGRLDVAMIQSLTRLRQVEDRVTSYGQVIVDECHHIPAVSFERVLSEVKARYVVGLTATLQRRDGHHPITEMQLGPVRFAVNPKSQAARRPFEHKLITRETTFRTKGTAQQAGIQALYAALASDDTRNSLILDDLMRALDEGRSPILLTERRDHLEYFAERLRSTTRRFVVLHGGMRVKERRELAARVAERPEGEGHLVLATGRYIGEGFDDARLDTLFLAMPISWKGTLVQYTGRIHRLHPGKKEVQIYDYVDREVPMLLRMFEKRLRTYRAIGYGRGEAPLGLAEPPVEPSVEYDEEALRHFEEET